MTSLRELYALAVEGAAQHFKNFGEVKPVALAITAQNEFVICPCSWVDDEERLAVLGAMRQAFAQLQVLQYAVVSEAWSLVQSVEEKRVQPRHSDRRQEVVTVVATDGVTCIFGLGEITRPFEGPAVLGPIEEMPPLEQRGGALTQLLTVKEEEKKNLN